MSPVEHDLILPLCVPLMNWRQTELFSGISALFLADKYHYAKPNNVSVINLFFVQILSDFSMELQLHNVMQKSLGCTEVPVR